MQSVHSRLARESVNVLRGQFSQSPTPEVDLLVPGKQGEHATPFSVAWNPARHSQDVISVLASADEVFTGHELQASMLSASVETPLKVPSGHTRHESACP
tara:strand:+ start:13359 stop:13658 length:300 start_codon:yes stop_codon:yes gene_type:complete